jgi:secreted PhoX family phosphatase
VTKDGRAVVYSGEDARFEYIYKFVSRDKIAPGGGKANATLLDNGTLYVARFQCRWDRSVAAARAWYRTDHRRQWLRRPGEVVIKSRQASDLLGGTKMDRPEWLAIDPLNQWVYCSLTYNNDRGKARACPAPTRPIRATSTRWARSSAGRRIATSTRRRSAGTT